MISCFCVSMFLDYAPFGVNWMPLIPHTAPPPPTSPYFPDWCGFIAFFNCFRVLSCSSYTYGLVFFVSYCIISVGILIRGNIASSAFCVILVNNSSMVIFVALFVYIDQVLSACIVRCAGTACWKNKQERVQDSNCCRVLWSEGGIDPRF